MGVAPRRPEFVLTFEGVALETHSMAVADLAPALLALGEIFHEANLVSDPGAPSVGLEIRAFEGHSFEVTLSLAQPGPVQGILRLLTGQDTDALLNLIVLVTFTFGAIVWLWRHRPARQERVAPGTTRSIAEDGTTLDIPSAVVALLQRPTVRKNAQRVVEPLRQEGVDTLKIESGGVEPLVVAASEREAFDVPTVPEVDLGSQQLAIPLTITTVNFAEGRKWRFSHGEEAFFATIEDEGFLKKVDTREETFAKGDILRCRVRLQDWQTETGTRHEWAVEEVLEHVRVGTNLTLSFGGPGSTPDEGRPRGSR